MFWYGNANYKQSFNPISKLPFELKCLVGCLIAAQRNQLEFVCLLFWVFLALQVVRVSTSLIKLRGSIILNEHKLQVIQAFPVSHFCISVDSQTFRFSYCFVLIWFWLLTKKWLNVISLQRGVHHQIWLENNFMGASIW